MNSNKYSSLKKLLAQSSGAPEKKRGWRTEFKKKLEIKKIENNGDKNLIGKEKSNI